MNIPVKRTAYILGSILIIAYAFQIIYSNYQANIELRNRSLQRAYTDFFDKYSSVKTYLKERQKDFQDLASDRTISTYFQNKAMGMTMMYGLAISLNNVKQRLISFQTTNNLGKHTLFPKIIFLDKNKPCVTVLADNLVDQITYDKDALIDSHKTSMQHDTTNPEYLIISTPCILKDKIVGHLIGWMSYGLFFDHFFQTSKAVEHVILLTGKTRNTPVCNSSDSNPINSEDIRGLLNRKEQTYTNPDDGTTFLIFSVNCDQTPFDAVKFISCIEIFGTDDPEKLLIRMVSICSLIFIFTVMLIRLNVKQQIGAIQLADAEERRRKIEQKNKELEIARKKEADANIKLQASQKEIESQNERLREMDRLKSEFLANMSHEIRTPMNGVIGMTDLLLKTELNEKQRRYVEVVNTSGQSLLTIINDILDFSKIEAKKLDLAHIAFDLLDVVEDLFLTLAFQAHEKGLELVMDMSPDMPLLLRGDPARLGQILTNLVGNAIKFTHMGEVVLYIDLTSESDNTAILRFRVKDTGIGIPLDRQEKMFDHFTQVDTSHTRQYGGTGLGLAISKQLSEMMGGEIGLISEEGKGSEFWFTVHLEKQERQDNNNARQSSELSGMRLLLVDDNDSSRKSFMRQMQSWNMQVSETSNGFDAIRMLYKALADNAPFQIALIDKDMPGLNGEALGRAIKAETRLTHLKMVVLNCSRAELNFEHFQKIGFNAFLAKPFKRSDLKNTLIKHLS